MNNYRVLIAEDDSDIVGVLKLYLENEGYDVLSASNGKAAYDLVKNEHVDLALVDIMMPVMNGYEFIQNVRKEFNFPIIVVSAKREDSDKVIGLNIGADDYLTKPFNPLEVVARVRSALRRFYELNPAIHVDEADEIKSGDLLINQRTLKLYKGGQEVLVTPTELKILMLLMQNPGRVFTKVQIYEYLNGEFYITDESTIMVHISNIRNKIEDDSKNPKYLITVRGLGYKFSEGI
jgi:DNA-binding response OmpR family regulator